MATATITVNLTATVGSASLPSGSITASPTLTGTDLGSSTQQVSTTYVVLNVPAAVTFPAHLLIANQSTSATLTVSVDNAGANKFSLLGPGEALLCPRIPAAPYVKFDVADQLVWRAVEI